MRRRMAVWRNHAGKAVSQRRRADVGRHLLPLPHARPLIPILPSSSLSSRRRLRQPPPHFLPTADLATPSLGRYRTPASSSFRLLLGTKKEEARGTAICRCCRPRAAEHGSPLRACPHHRRPRIEKLPGVFSPAGRMQSCEGPSSGRCRTTARFVARVAAPFLLLCSEVTDVYTSCLCKCL